MRRILALVLALLAFPALAQTPGAINLVGPSTVPGAPQVTPLAINTAVNSALGLKADAANPTLTGITTLRPGTQAVSAAVAPVLDFAAGFTGTATGNPAFVYSGLKLVISPDTLALPNANQFFAGLEFQHNFGGTGFSGNRQAQKIILNQSAAIANPPGSGTSGFYTTQQLTSQMAFNAGGTGLTSGTAVGRAFAAGLETKLNSGATNFFQASGMEINVAIASGASALARSFLSLAALSGPVQGTAVDAGLWFYSAGGALMKTGMLFGGGTLNNWPLDPAGTIIGSDASGSVAAQAAIGIDFSGVTFSGFSLKLPGFTVDGTGRPTAFSTLFLTPTGGFGTIDPGSATLLLKSGSTGSNGTVQALSPFTAPTLAATKNIAFSGAPSTSAGGVRLASTLTGSLTTGQQPYLAIVLQNDAVAQTNISSTVEGIGIFHTVAAGATGNRWMVDASSASTVASTDLHLGGYRATVTTSANMGGTGLTAVLANGNLFGANFVTQAFSGATFLAGVNALELDAEMRAGSSSYAKIALGIVQLANDGVQGAVDDQAISFNNQAAPVAGQAWLSLIGVGRNGGYPPLDPTNGWILTVTAHLGAGTVAAAGGLDLTNLAPATAFIQGTGFKIDPAGIMTASAYKVGAMAGVSCSAGVVSLVTEVVTNGIVTHC